MPLNCCTGEDSWKSLGQHEFKPVNLKGYQTWIFPGRTDAEAPVFCLKLRYFQSSDVNRWLIGKVLDAGKDWGREEKRASEDEMDGWHHWYSEHELGHTPEDGEGQGDLACCSPWQRKKLDMTGQLNNNKAWYTVVIFVLSNQLSFKKIKTFFRELNHTCIIPNTFPSFVEVQISIWCSFPSFSRILLNYFYWKFGGELFFAFVCLKDVYLP